VDEPVLTVLTVVDDLPALQETYRALVDQKDRRWQWCITGLGDQDARLVAGLPLDPRVTSVPGSAADGWARLLDRALETASGTHVMVLPSGGRLSRRTVGDVAELPADRWAYTDERQLFRSGRTPDVWCKPDYAPEWLRSQPFAASSAILPTARLRELGGIRPDAGSAAWYDAVLRISEATDLPRHIARPHVTRRAGDVAARFVQGSPEEFAAVVREHCERIGLPVEEISPIVVQGRPVGQRLVPRLTRRPSVSVIIPTRGSTSVIQGQPRRHVVELVRSLWTADRYADLELVVVYDVDTPSDVLDELRAIVGDELVLCAYDDWFHFSRKCNLGAVAAGGEYLCFLNDDMEVLTPDWLVEMVGRLQDPEVGAVGARLFFGDGSLQHIGHEYVDGDAGHPLFGWRASTLALGAAAHVAGERSGVTAACLLVRAEDFLRVGGFSDTFPSNYNDVDLCLKLRETGFRIVYTPHAEFFHYESQTRVPRILASEKTLLQRRWPVRMRRDPYIHHARPALARTKTATRAWNGTGPAAVPADPDLTEETT
jgi:GT2 family glycosyltransferase